MPVTVKGSGGGGVTLDAGAAASDTTLTLPNTTGTVALTASPTFSGTVTATTITSPAATALTVQSAGTTAMTVDTSQNVGIGTSSPARKLDIEQSGTSYQMRIGDAGGSNYYDIGRDTSNGLLTFYGSQSVASGYVFSTVNGERMRIDTSGNLLVGTTSQLGTSKETVVGSGSGQISLRHSSASAGKYWHIGPDSGSSNFVVYNENNLGCYITDGGSTWSSSSDERAKDIIEPISDGLVKVSSLRAIIGSYKIDEKKKRRSFLIAQDVQAVLPEAVDASNPDSLGLAYTDVIPLLVAAIQELSAKNDALEARLAALEAK